MTDVVNKPDHYRVPPSPKYPNGLECLDAIESLGLSFCLGNTFKYIWRAGRKTSDREEDLRKARFYLDREIARIQKRKDDTVDERRMSSESYRVLGGGA